MGEFRFMDLLYSRYASPMDLVNLYLDQGRFGEFVENIIELENERRKAEAEKQDEQKLWSAYINSMTDKNFIDWKNGLMEKQPVKQSKVHTRDEDMTEDDIQGILDKLFP